MFNIKTPAQAKQVIEDEIKKENISQPKNLEEQAISLVGRTVYEKLVKGYTEKTMGTRLQRPASFYHQASAAAIHL